MTKPCVHKRPTFMYDLFRIFSYAQAAKKQTKRKVIDNVPPNRDHVYNASSIPLKQTCTYWSTVTYIMYKAYIM